MRPYETTLQQNRTSINLHETSVWHCLAYTDDLLTVSDSFWFFGLRTIGLLWHLWTAKHFWILSIQTHTDRHNEPHMDGARLCKDMLDIVGSSFIIIDSFDTIDHHSSSFTTFESFDTISNCSPAKSHSRIAVAASLFAEFVLYPFFETLPVANMHWRQGQRWNTMINSWRV